MQDCPRFDEGDAPGARYSTWQDLCKILLLLVLATIVRVWHISHTEVTARDGVGFIRYAWDLEHFSWKEVLRSNPHPPLYPLTILAVSLPAPADGRRRCPGYAAQRTNCNRPGGRCSRNPDVSAGEGAGWIPVRILGVRALSVLAGKHSSFVRRAFGGDLAVVDRDGAAGCTVGVPKSVLDRIWRERHLFWTRLSGSSGRHVGCGGNWRGVGRRAIGASLASGTGRAPSPALQA